MANVVATGCVWISSGREMLKSVSGRPLSSFIVTFGNRAEEKKETCKSMYSTCSFKSVDKLCYTWNEICLLFFKAPNKARLLASRRFPS